MTARDVDEVTRYYESKTAAILSRYGPGPRVHFHTGVVDALPEPSAAPSVLHRHVWESQEAVLAEACAPFAAQLAGTVLDVGCGLGGGSLYLAERFGAHVEGITVAPSHPAVVERLAHQAGVGARVRARHADAMTYTPPAPLDALIAVESVCYLDRSAWFERAATWLRPGGVGIVADVCLGTLADPERFNPHWRTRIGSVLEYITAAERAGLRTLRVIDVSDRASRFWTLTGRLLAADHGAELSLREHAKVEGFLASGELRQAIFAFQR